MEEIRLFCGGQPRGAVTLDRGDSRREVRAEMADPGDGLYRAFLVGERGELPLGVMEPQRGALAVCRRLYARDVAALGALQRCLEGTPRALRRREGERQLLAFPVEEGRPFPLEPLFCLARIRRVEGQLCAVYAFDREGRPLSP